jgi:hypothetical protein
MSETHNRSRSWWNEHTAAIEDADTVRADLFVRSLGAPVDSQHCHSSVVQRLDELEANGPVTTVTIRLWGDRLYPDGRCADTPAGRFILDKIEEMESWAAQTERVQLRFERTQATSALSDESRTMIRLPYHCLSVYLDDSLSAVLPCSVDGRECSLFEYVDTLATMPEATVSPPNTSVDPAKIQ